MKPGQIDFYNLKQKKLLSEISQKFSDALKNMSSYCVIENVELKILK
jgi:hypothetical protein